MQLTNAFAFALPWLAAVPVALLVAVAVAAVGRLPGKKIFNRWLRVAGTVIVGSLAMAGTVWQALEIRDGPGNATAVAESNHAASRTPDLQNRIKSLEIRVRQLEHSTTMRMISPDLEKKLADYLESFGRHSIVVLCVPNDIEAYDYATQLTNLFKMANWDARGPELTTIFGDVQAMGINIYDDGTPDGDTVDILLRGLAKFNIPFQVRVAPRPAPDDGTVDLFVGAQPVVPTVTATDQRP